MAELGRAAQAALRSTCSLLRAAPMRSQSSCNVGVASSISTLRPSHISLSSRSTPLSRTQQRSYAAFNSGSSNNNSWSNPMRDQRVLDDISQIAEIQKPNSAAYEQAFGDQSRGKKDYRKGKDTALDEIALNDISDVSPKPPMLAPKSAPRPQMRMVPRTGRTVHVTNNIDVAKSFKFLAIQVSQNRLRNDFYLQRFHERPGMKRKRLKSERWQKRFKQGFKATISRVRELTAQGW